jgi:hypothetical protein
VLFNIVRERTVWYLKGPVLAIIGLENWPILEGSE